MTQPSRDQRKMNYRDSGVDIEAGNALVERIKSRVKQTFRPGVLQGIGGFGALFELPLARYKNPVLVSGTDGVGTKLKLAGELNAHDSIGIDLVAMCVNDIVVSGAEPLYFLDYFATGRLDVDQAEEVINGIVQGCELAGCALTGGETAEMPGMYAPGDYDLAGFAVGIVEKTDIITADRVQPGNVLLGLGSSGPHSNGYSLIRKILERNHCDLQQDFNDNTLAQALIEPTRIYVKSILALIAQIRVNGIAHITGGGITENLPRILPPGVGAEISLDSWTMPPIFHWLKEQGGIENREMYRTFNCGLGMIVCVNASDVDKAVAALQSCGEQVFIIGETVKSDQAAITLS